jgi:DNA-3-methyladenine glycosylase II
METSFDLFPHPPFRLDFTVWVLRRRVDNLWDRWDGQTYRRVLAGKGGPVEVAVIQTGPPAKPALKVMARSEKRISSPSDSEEALAPALERMLGLQYDLSPFYDRASRDGKLKILAERFRGVKPPRYPTVFEALVNAITCQQFTLTAGIRLLNRLVTSVGVAFPGADGVARAFPRPEDVAGVEVETLRNWGFSAQKARALTDLARMITSRQLDLESLAGLDDAAAMERLQELRGVGRWTAEYALLRGLGRVHIFPGDDVGVRNKLERWLNMKSRLDYEGVRKILNRWRPFGGLIYFHLLLQGLGEALSAPPDR